MQPVNDDMDHLFRQAANDYPLNTQGADFDKLQQRMQTEVAEVPTKKGHRRHFAWLLLLLIALPFTCEHQENNVADGIKRLATQHNSTSGQLDKQDLSSQKSIITNGDSSPVKTTIDNSNPATENKKAILSPAPLAQEDLVSRKTVSTHQSMTPKNNDTNTGSTNLFLSSKKTITKETYPNTIQAIATKKKKRQRSNDKLSSPINSSPSQDVAIIKSGKTASLKSNNSSTTGQNFNTADKDSTAKATSINSTQTVQRQPDTAATLIKEETLKDNTAQDTTAQKRQLRKTDNPSSYLYAGIVIGPDYSVVKSTRTGNIGYNTGVVAGYYFAKHWAVETGLLWNHKSYYSDGQYVSAEKLMLPSHTQVQHINGYCNLFEIPLNVQYHFSSKSKGHWYVATGVASYLMKQEEYYYLYKRYNMDYYGKKEYSNSTNNWFSVLRLGGGYQLQLGRQSSLRIEPYAKLPISKIGIAKLPLSSTGLNIGYLMAF